MLKVTFKNVGQGDSIILEWLEKTQDAQQISKKCIGIIDCNLHQGKNPVLLYIQNDLNMVSFVVDNGKDCIFKFENGMIQEI